MLESPRPDHPKQRQSQHQQQHHSEGGTSVAYSSNAVPLALPSPSSSLVSSACAPHHHVPSLPSVGHSSGLGAVDSTLEALILGSGDEGNTAMTPNKRTPKRSPSSSSRNRAGGSNGGGFMGASLAERMAGKRSGAHTGNSNGKSHSSGGSGGGSNIDSSYDDGGGGTTGSREMKDVELPSAVPYASPVQTSHATASRYNPCDISSAGAAVYNTADEDPITPYNDAGYGDISGEHGEYVANDAAAGGLSLEAQFDAIAASRLLSSDRSGTAHSSEFVAFPLPSTLPSGGAEGRARCCRLVVAGPSFSRGHKQSLFSKCACDNIRCIGCNFQVKAFPNAKWIAGSHYMFFRNNFADDRKLVTGLERQDSVAYCCQCNWTDVSAGEERTITANSASQGSLQWVCGGHSVV